MSTDTKNPGRKRAKRKPGRDTSAFTAGSKLARSRRKRQIAFVDSAAGGGEKAKRARKLLKQNQARRKARK